MSSLSKIIRQLGYIFITGTENSEYLLIILVLEKAR